MITVLQIVAWVITLLAVAVTTYSAVSLRRSVKRDGCPGLSHTEVRYK